MAGFAVAMPWAAQFALPDTISVANLAVMAILTMGGGAVALMLFQTQAAPVAAHGRYAATRRADLWS
jgi:hypothetical protein